MDSALVYKFINVIQLFGNNFGISKTLYDKRCIQVLLHHLYHTINLYQTLLFIVLFDDVLKITKMK